jgi:ATP-dependent Clp protease protease subunit
MAVLNIFNDIQSEQDKAVTRMWGMEPGISFRVINQFCDSIPDDDNTIDVHIHCNGGDVLEGWAIYDRLRATGKEITTIVDGTAASMATVIMMAAPKERRKAYANAQILVHNPWLDPAWIGLTATADDLEKAAESLKAQQDRILDLYVERCGCDREEMAALMAEDKFISVERAMELGMVGEIIAPISASINKVKHMSIRERIINAINSVFGSSEDEPRMMAMELATASGDTLTIDREEGAPAVGDKAEPDGEWLMPDNTTIVVEEGVITEIRQPEEQVEAAEEGDGQEGDEPAEETDGESELEKENAALKERIAELEAQIAELTERLEQAEAKAKTQDDLRILNMVAMAGGAEKVFTHIQSTYKPETREPVTAKTEEAVERNYIRERIEAARKKK